jgi:O-antigen/teichoic acid export membrane protein
MTMPDGPETGVARGQGAPVSGSLGSRFVTDAAKLAGGAILAQALGILVAPILSRLFAPEAFGTAALFSSIVQVIGVFVCLRYERAIMLPEKDEDASSLLVASLFIAGGIALLSAGVTLLLGGAAVRWLQAPDLAPYLWLLPVAVLVYGIGSALRQWNTRTKHFGLLSGAQIASAAGQAAVKLGTGLFGFTVAGSLIGARVLGLALPATGLAWGAWKEHRHRHLQTGWRRIAGQLWRYRKFPLVSTWSGLLNTLSVQLPILILSAFFVQAVVGFYSFGARMVDLPMILIGTAITQVFYQRASAAKNQGELAQVVRGTYDRLVALGVFPMLVLTVIGPELFGLVFGSEWVEAGVYVQILSLWRFLVFIGSPMSTLFGILERLEVGLAFNVVLMLTRFASLTAGGWAGNARLALALYAASGSVIWLGMILWLLRESGTSVWQATLHSVRYLLYSLPIVLLLVVAKAWWGWPTWVLVSLAVAGALAYYGIVIQQDRTLTEPFVRWLDRLRGRSQ